MSRALLAALIAALAVLFALPGRTQAQQASDQDAMYGAWMLAPGETLLVRLEEEAHYQYVASNCSANSQFVVNGGEMYGGVIWFAGVDVTVYNGTDRSCWIEVRGRMDRCVGSGCPDNSQHWAVRNRGVGSGAGAVGFAREMDNIFGNNVVRFVLILIVGTIAGSAVVEMFRRIAGGEDEEDLDDYSDYRSDDE